MSSQTKLQTGQKYRALEPQGATISNYLRSIANSLSGRTAVLIQLSKLQPHNHQSYHLRAIRLLLKSFGQIYDGQQFLLHNKDILFLVNRCEVTPLKEQIIKILDLFQDDPLSSTFEGRGSFATYFILPRDFDVLRSFADKVGKDEDSFRLKAAQKNSRHLTSGSSGFQTGGISLDDDDVDISLSLISRFEDALKGTDLSTYIRNQPICKIPAPDAPPEPFFHELYISMVDLGDTILPDLPMEGDSWLLQHISQILDERILILLTKYSPKSLNRSINLNLNIGTVLSPLFLEFDDIAQENKNNRIIIELQQVDVFMNLSRFFFARDFLHERGYKVCLDNVSPLMLPLLDRRRMGIDLIKLTWGAELSNLFSSRREVELKEAIHRNDPQRLIISNCTSVHALNFGHEFGIVLYQGQFIDRLLSQNPLPTRKILRSS